MAAKLLNSVLAVSLAAVPAAAAARGAGEYDRSAATRALDAELRSVIRDGDPGCTAALSQNGRMLAVAAMGQAGGGDARPLDEDTAFYAASVSKQFTGLAIAQLVVAGKLRLDDDALRWLPELPRYAKPVTVAMLLHHVAGIRDTLTMLTLDGRPDYSRTSYETALGLILRQTDTDFEPGTQFSYSNGGYLLLAEIVKRASGQPYASYVNENILKPLGMRSSFVLAGQIPAEVGIVGGHMVEDGKVGDQNNFPRFGGSGGLVTTVRDLVRYDRDIDSGHRVWTAPVRRLMLEIGRKSDGAPALMPDYGFGYSAGLMVGPAWFGHPGGGASSGFINLFARLPERRLGIQILCNRSDLDIFGLADGIIAKLDAQLPKISSPYVPVSSVSGRYGAADLSSIYSITASGKQLKLVIEPRNPAADEVELLLTRDRDGSYSGGGLRLVPDLDRAGLRVRSASTELHLNRLDPAQRR